MRFTWWAFMFRICVCAFVCVYVYLVKSVFVLHWQYVILHEITSVNIAVISLTLRSPRVALFESNLFKWTQREMFTPQGPADGGLLSRGGGTFDAAGQNTFEVKVFYFKIADEWRKKHKLSTVRLTLIGLGTQCVQIVLEYLQLFSQRTSWVQ